MPTAEPATARERAQRAALLLRGTPDDKRREVAVAHDLLDVFERAERVDRSLRTFARENHLINNVHRRLDAATRDERTWLDRALDGVRKAVVDSQPWSRRENPDVSPDEAREILADLEELALPSRLRVGWYLAEGLRATVALAEGNEREVVALFRDFVQRAERHPGDPEACQVQIEQARLEQEFFRRLDGSRQDSSDAGTTISEGEMLGLLRIIDRLQQERRGFFLDALAAICLTPIGFAPEAGTANATPEAQTLLAESFWQAEAGRDLPPRPA